MRSNETGTPEARLSHSPDHSQVHLLHRLHHTAGLETSAWKIPRISHLALFLVIWERDGWQMDSTTSLHLRAPSHLGSLVHLLAQEVRPIILEASCLVQPKKPRTGKRSRHRVNLGRRTRFKARTLCPVSFCFLIKSLHY